MTIVKVMLYTCFIRIDIKIIILYLISAISYADTIFYSPNSPPAGFEDLAAEQYTEVDVFFGGHKITAVFARFSPGNFSFDKPENLLHAIPHAKNTQKLIQALSGQLETHSDLVCQKPRVPKGCGHLQPDIAGIIFNENQFSVDVFINSQFLDIIPLNVGNYLPWPGETAGLGGMINFNGNLAGSTQNEVRYDLGAKSILSYGLTHLNIDMHVSGVKGYQIESIVAERDSRNWVLRGGMLRNTPVRLLSQKEILGVYFGSSLKMRTDLERAYGNEVMVFLPRRAMVSVFREERLLSSQMYEAGNQMLDTQNFPNGAYDINIVIDDPLLGEQQETQFYSKATDIPPLGSPSYFIEAGVMRSDQRDDILPKYSLEGLVNIGGAMRFTDTFGADIGFLASQREQIFSFGAVSLHRVLNSQLRLGMIVTTQGDYGVEFSGFGNYQGLAANFSFRKLLSDTDAARDQFDLLPLSFTQATVNLGYIIWRLRFNLRANWQENYRPETESTAIYSITPSVGVQLLRYRGIDAFLNLQHTFANNDNLTLASLNIQYSSQGRWSFLGNIEAQHQHEQMRYSGNLRAHWQDNDLFPADLRAELGLKSQKDNYALQARGEYRGVYGGGAAFVDYSILPRDTNITNYGGNFNFSVLAEQQGVALGGQYPEKSAVIIDLRGSPEGAGFDVEIIQVSRRVSRNSRHFSVFVGQANALPLRPYETYQIRLIARKDTFAEFDTSPRLITLYPGMIQRLTWEVKQVYILITAIVDENGLAVANARVEGAIEPAFTDSSGFLQADVEAQAKLVLTRESGGICLVQVPEVTEAMNVVTLKGLVCQPLN
ncbi:MAG: hypothetical protein GQ583_00205 [Methyloprofundus sp.]|nr:hypothetical protein [Methyloprofundus sp.]